MHIYCTEIEFASPQFDEALFLRDLLLRQPLNIEFRLDDIKKEYSEFHLGIFSPWDELVGTLTFRHLDNKLLKMRQLAISEQYQGKQLGKRLVQFAEEWALRRGYEKIELSARVPVVEFYVKLGYQKVGEEFEEVGIAHRKMEKEIS
jgi:predicted GNAT family N-acyltransferase